MNEPTILFEVVVGNRSWLTMDRGVRDSEHGNQSEIVSFAAIAQIWADDHHTRSAGARLAKGLEPTVRVRTRRNQISQVIERELTT